MCALYFTNIVFPKNISIFTTIFRYMSRINENIRHLRKKEGWTQQDLADHIGIKRSLVGAYEEARAEPSADKLIRFSEAFNVSVDSLISKDLRKESSDEKPFKVLSITVDKEDKENIEFVRQKAAAGYMNGYADTDYVSSLPRFQLPFLPTNATYRAFEISGDSMLPIPSGTVIIGKYVETLSEVKSGNTYVLVTKKEGVVFKRVFNYLEEKNKLYLTSDNKLFSPFEMEPQDILEIWSATAYISVEFPNPQDPQQKSDVNLESLLSVVSGLKDDIQKLKQKE
jgi:transcriptional regulator with XRE-family HTH domain